MALSLHKLKEFDHQQLLNKLMRRQNIEYSVRGIRAFANLVSIAAIALMLYFGVQQTLERRNKQAELESQIQRVRSAALESGGTTGKDSSDGSRIAVRNVFGPLGAKSAVEPKIAPPPTPLSLTLVGTFLTDGEAPYAIIEDKKKQTQDSFSLNQNVFGQAILKKIFDTYVEIERLGKREILKLDDLGDSGPSQGGVASLGSDEFVVDEAELDKGLENLPLLLTQARAVPYFKDGRSIGLRLFAIKTGSLYEKIGLKNGDILKSINGNNLGDISQALKLFEQLKQERSINLELERDRQGREFKYTIR